MKRLLYPFLVLSVFLAAVACQKTGELKTSDLASKDVEAPASGGGIAPIGPNVGGITPITGSESLGGGSGGGVGQAAKEMARSRASGASAVGGASQAAGMLSGEGE